MMMMTTTTTTMVPGRKCTRAVSFLRLEYVTLIGLVIKLKGVQSRGQEEEEDDEEADVGVGGSKGS